MKRKLLSRHPSPAMVVALIALCSSLAAGAAAATLITSKNIKNGTITEKDIKKNAVRSKQVKNRSLLSKDFKKGQLAGGSGTAIKMARLGPRNFKDIASSSPTEVVSLDITAPAGGFVSLSYSATIDNETPGTWIEVFLMEGGDRLNGIEWWDPGDNDHPNYDLTQGNQLVVPVTAGTHTYSVRLKMSAGTASVHDARMTALFVANSL